MQGVFQSVILVRNVGIKHIDLPQKLIQAGQVVQRMLGGFVFMLREKGVHALLCVGQRNFDGLFQVCGKCAADDIKLYNPNFSVIGCVDAHIFAALGNKQKLTAF